MNEARREMERLTRLLATMDSESPEAETVREESDKWWPKLSGEEVAECRAIAASLERPGG